jgi:hypothetical protein
MGQMKLVSFLEEERHLANINYMRFNREYSLPYPTVSNDKAAISGFNGWLFIQGGSNFWEKQVKGELYLNDSQLDTYATFHQQCLDFCTKNGVKYSHVVFPEKQSVLPHKRWESSLVSLDRPACQLASILDDSFIYLADELRQFSNIAEVYYRGNSHASLSGVWYVFERTAKKMWPDRAFDFDSLAIEKKQAQHDLLVKYTNHGCEEAYLGIQKKYQLISDNQQLTKTGRHTGSHFISKNDNAIYSESIAIFGDSYSFDAGFFDLFAVFFKTVHFVWTNTLDLAYIKTHNIDAAIVENAERFLINSLQTYSLN